MRLPAKSESNSAMNNYAKDLKLNFNYDLHIHSCLSPCGDNDMTPNNIVNMAYIKNLSVIAISDHNTTKNCGAVIKACENNGLPLTVIPAVEITTSEDIHVVVYFRDIDSAEAFDREVIEKKRFVIKNKPEIFGNQIIMNEFDEKTGEEENLLINAIDLSVDAIYKTAKNYGATAVPAHIDKDANGLIAILGDYPDYMSFTAAEIKDKDRIAEIVDKCGLIDKGIKKILSSSDAHYLWDIAEYDERESLSKKITADYVLSLLEGC